MKFVIKWNNLYMKFKDNSVKGVPSFASEWVEDPYKASIYGSKEDAESVKKFINVFNPDINYEVVEVEDKSWVERIAHNDYADNGIVKLVMRDLKNKVLEVLDDNEHLEHVKYGKPGEHFDINTYYTKDDIKQVFEDLGVE